MKKIIFAITITLLITSNSFSQYKDIPANTKNKLKSSNGLILGFINPKKFSISHSFNATFINAGDANVSLTSYTATINYAILHNLNVSADVTMQYSPFASVRGYSNTLNKDFQNSFNGINLSRVALDYSPSKSVHISLNYINNTNNFWLYDNYYFRNAFLDGR